MTTPDTIAGFPFFELEFGSDGAALFSSQADRLTAETGRAGVTDLIVLAHGFRCGAAEATSLYSALLGNIRAQLTRPGLAASLAGRTLASAGVYWPSQAFPEASMRAALSAAHPAGQSLGGLLAEILNVVSWPAMKTLSGAAGVNGLAPVLLAWRREYPSARLHLVGHSLGGRLVTACCGALAGQRGGRVASLSLLQAAFSQFGFSPDAGHGEPGFFRGVMEGQVVCGPLISTFSKQDAVVGLAYALASRLAHDNLQAIGDAADAYGAIGHNGAQRTPESVTLPLRRAGEVYQFRPGVVTCLDGSAPRTPAGPSGAGLIASHGDVANPHVACAVASAICQPA